MNRDGKRDAFEDRMKKWAEHLDVHVRERQLPAPGDDHALATVIGEVLGEPLDRSRPLWELNLVRGLSGGCVRTKSHP